MGLTTSEEIFPFTDELSGVEVDGISTHSPPDTSSLLRKKGHSLMSMMIDSFASAIEMGTGDDFITALMTSLKGRAFRFREGVEKPPVVGSEKSL